MSSSNGSLRLITVNELRPSQPCVGLASVSFKVQKMMAKAMKYHDKGAKKGPAKWDEYLREKRVPVIHGPGHALYITDHHHFIMAIILLANDTTWRKASTIRPSFVTNNVYIVENPIECPAVYQSLPSPNEEYWLWAEKQGIAWPRFEAKYTPPPTTWNELRDDPWRSIAAFIRHPDRVKQLGYHKPEAKSDSSSDGKDGTSKDDEEGPADFVEFPWADFLRTFAPLQAHVNTLEQTHQINRATIGWEANSTLLESVVAAAWSPAAREAKLPYAQAPPAGHVPPAWLTTYTAASSSSSSSSSVPSSSSTVSANIASANSSL